MSYRFLGQNVNVMGYWGLKIVKRAAVAEWFISSWLAEQEDRGSFPGLAT